MSPPSGAERQRRASERETRGNDTMTDIRSLTFRKNCSNGKELQSLVGGHEAVHVLKSRYCMRNVTYHLSDVFAPLVFVFNASHKILESGPTGRKGGTTWRRNDFPLPPAFDATASFGYDEYRIPERKLRSSGLKRLDS